MRLLRSCDVLVKTDQCPLWYEWSFLMRYGLSTFRVLAVVGVCVVAVSFLRVPRAALAALGDCPLPGLFMSEVGKTCENTQPCRPVFGCQETSQADPKDACPGRIWLQRYWQLLSSDILPVGSCDLDAYEPPYCAKCTDKLICAKVRTYKHYDKYLAQRCTTECTTGGFQYWVGPNKCLE
jgi:hypothetical protein